MSWVVTLEEVRDRKVLRRRTLMSIDRPTTIDSADDIGLRLEDARQLLRSVQQFLAAAQFRHDAERRRTCSACGSRQRIKDYRPRTVDTLYGRVTARCPRYHCRGCGVVASLPKLQRSSAEFDRIRAELAAQLPFRQVTALLSRLLPVEAGIAHTTIRNRIAHVAAQLEQHESESDTEVDVAAAPERVLGLDTAHVRSTTPRLGHHHPVLVGCVERQQTRRYFAVMQQMTSAASATIRTQLDTMGYRPGRTDLTVFTDGANVLRSLARAACGTPVRPLLDGFHIAIRLQHMRQTARGLSTRVHTHRVAREAIEQELEKLRWRLWHGRVDSVERFRRELSSAIRRFHYYNRGHRRNPLAYRTLWGKLFNLKDYVCNNEVHIPNYHRRHQARQRVSTALVESAVNSVVNQRMNKRQQMRWSEKGAQNVLRVRMARVRDGHDQRADPVAAPADTQAPSIALAA